MVGDNFVVFDGGAKRSDVKPFYRKIPIAGIKRLAMTLCEGSQKYDLNLYHSNWRAGGPDFAAACFDHAIEHLYKWMEGDQTEDHLAHATANLFFLMHFEEAGVYTPNTLNYKEGDFEIGEDDAKELGEAVMEAAEESGAATAGSGGMQQIWAKLVGKK